MARKLKPCPFCESLSVMAVGNGRFVYCTGCNMRGPVQEDDNEATEAWNDLPSRRSTARLAEVVKTLLYWHERDHIDESWWAEAAEALKQVKQ